jgi:hypothetical protein
MGLSGVVAFLFVIEPSAHLTDPGRARRYTVSPIAGSDCGFSCLPSSAKHQVTSVCLLTHARSVREFFHTFGDDRGQSHHLLAQVCVFRNVALNAIAIVL